MKNYAKFITVKLFLKNIMNEITKQKINAYLKKIVNPFLTKGIVKMIIKIPSYFLTDNLIFLLKENNFNPNLILDIGANHGRWTRKWKDAFKNTKIIMVEPQLWLKNSFKDLLKDCTITFINAGVSNQNGTMKFTINSERDDSSTFTMSASQASNLGYKQIDVEVITINEIIIRNDGIIPDLIKIDAEGLDMKVLEGADLALGKTPIFMIEVSVNNFTADNNIVSMIKFMDCNGYKIFDITELNRPFKHSGLWQLELVFVKKEMFNFIN
jgi:FkbM family methyltransferase